MRGIEKKISEEFNVSQQEVHQIVQASYEYLESLLRNEFTTYELSGLGTLTFREKKGRQNLETDHRQYPNILKNQEAISKKLNGNLEQ